ncbi:MAG: hypothetical protein U0446_00780 [Dehalococcoidia bacterium]
MVQFERVKSTSTIARIDLLHLTAFQKPSGGDLAANAESFRNNPLHQQHTDRDDLARSNTGCSWQGEHAHIEVFNYHSFGYQYEWHGYYGDAISGDGYNGLPGGIADHVHQCFRTSPPCPNKPAFPDEPNMAYDEYNSTFPYHADVA